MYGLTGCECVSETADYFNGTKFNLFNKYLLSTYYLSGTLRSKIRVVSCSKKEVQRFQSIFNSEAQTLW